MDSNNIIRLAFIDPESINAVGYNPEGYWWVREDYFGHIPDEPSIFLDKDGNILLIPAGYICEDYFKNPKLFTNITKVCDIFNYKKRDIEHSEKNIKFWLINCDENIDRLTAFDKKFKTCFPNFSYDRIACIKPNDRGYFKSIGARGCYSSHLEVLHRIKEYYQGFANIIMEDDCEFDIKLHKYFLDYIKIFQKNKKADMLYFYDWFNDDITSNTPFIRKTRTWLTHFYCVQNISKVLEVVRNNFKKEDIDQLYRNSTILNKFSTNISLVRQNRNFSSTIDFENLYFNNYNKNCIFRN